MTLAEAREILKAPKFGDAECIKAIKIVEDETDALRLRTILVGKKVECWCCDGNGELRCSAGCVHQCPTCEGEDSLTLTPYILKDLHLWQLREIAQEVKVTV